MFNLRSPVTMRINHDLEIKQRLLRVCADVRGHTHTRKGRSVTSISLRSHYRMKGFLGTGKWTCVSGTSVQVLYRKDGIQVVKINFRLSKEEEDEALQKQEGRPSPGG